MRNYKCDAMAIGQRLKDARLSSKKGMTQLGFAEEIGVCVSNISKTEQGLRFDLRRFAVVTKADETFNIPIWNKVMLTKEEAAAYSHIGINKLEELLKIPNCPFVLYVGKKKLIKRAEFERYLLENIEI